MSQSSRPPTAPLSDFLISANNVAWLKLLRETSRIATIQNLYLEQAVAGFSSTKQHSRSFRKQAGGSFTTWFPRCNNAIWHHKAWNPPRAKRSNHKHCQPVGASDWTKTNTNNGKGVWSMLSSLCGKWQSMLNLGDPKFPLKEPKIWSDPRCFKGTRMWEDPDVTMLKHPEVMHSPKVQELVGKGG